MPETAWCEFAAEKAITESSLLCKLKVYCLKLHGVNLLLRRRSLNPHCMQVEGIMPETAWCEFVASYPVPRPAFRRCLVR